MIKRIVLDSWAVLAWLQGEASGEIVRDLVAFAEGKHDLTKKIQSHLKENISQLKLFVNVINLGEVFYLIGRRIGKQQAEEVIDKIKAGPIEIIPANELIVFQAASIKMNHAIAYADAFAVATAVHHQSSLATGDPELKRIPGVSVLWLGGA